MKSKQTKKQIKARLEYLRGELRAERISYGEIIELQSLAKHIDAGDVELLEAAGVPENPPQKQSTAQHTPAPWIVDDRHVHAEQFIYRDDRILTDGDDTVCEVNTDCRKSGLLTETDKANLRLIAAAPEMLDTLQNTAQAWDKSDLGEEIDIAEIRAVIAKATNGTAPAPAAKPKFFITFSNDDVEFFVAASYIWTEEGLNDLHVQFNGPSQANYFPKIVKGKFAIQKRKGGKVFLCKSMEIRASRPERGIELSPAVLKSFWYSPNI